MGYANLTDPNYRLKTNTFGQVVDILAPGGSGASFALSAAQQANTNVVGPAGVGNGKIYDENGNEIVISGGGGSSAITYTTVSNTSVTTSATQSAAVAFPAAACNAMIIVGGIQAIEYKRTGDSAYHPIRPFETKFVFGITDASQVSVRRQDSASIRATQWITVKATLINTSTAVASRNTNVTTTANSTFTAFPSIACTYVEITNNTTWDAYLRFGGSTTNIPLKRDETILVPVTANANEISAVSANNARVLTLNAETFQAYPTLPRRQWNKPTILNEDTILRLGEWSGYDTLLGTEFAMIPSFAPFTKFNLKGKMLSIFNTAAHVIASGATVADTTLTAGDVYATRGVAAQFGSVSTPVVTSTATTFSIMSSVNTPAGVDVTNSAIHVGIHRLNFSQTVTGYSIDLFSAGTPASPAADYHRLTVNPTTAGVNGPTGVNDCFATSNGFGAKSYGINLFSAVGAGANLSAITYARITITTSAIGMQVRPSFIKAVKNYTNKGSIIFSVDDNYSSAINAMLPLISPYNFPAVLFNSPMMDKLGNQNNSTGNWTIDQLRMLQDQFGWQIGSQEFANGSTVDGGELSSDRSDDEWLKLQARNFVAGASFGFDLDGMRDGSYAGGYTYNTTSAQAKQAQKMFASMRMAMNPYNTDASLSGMARYCDTNPPADPWKLLAVNSAPAGWSSNATGANLAARYQEYAQQAIDAKGIAWFYFHDDWSNSNVQTAMATFLPWLAGQVAAGNAQVVTPRELRRQQAWAALATN